jgi:hypothetical protein
MQRYLDVDSLEGGKIELTVKIYNGSNYITVRKYIFMRIDLTPFSNEIYTATPHLTVYAKGLGEFALDQSMTIPNTLKVLTVNGVEVTDNTDLYGKLRLL